MKDEFERRAREALESGATLDQFHDLLREAASKGLPREDARRILEGLRGATSVDDEEDRLLEVLDIVTDFCRPQHRIPWNR